MAGDDLRLERDRARMMAWTRAADTAPPRAAIAEPAPTDRFADTHEVWSPPSFLFTAPPVEALAEVAPASQRELLDAKTRASVAVLVRGGLDEADAIALLTRGVDATAAAGMLSVRMLQPCAGDYGAALLTLRLLSEARATGGLTAARARAICDAHRSMVVVRPDGVVAEVTSGRALERRAPPAVRDGRLEAGGLVVGATYHLSGGVLREIDETFAPMAIIGELGLDRGTVGAALDGAEDAMADVVRGLAKTIDGLIFRPEAQTGAMIDGFGGIPRAVATLIRRSPELYATFQALPQHDRVEAIAKLVTSLFLVTTGAAAGAKGVSSAGRALGGLEALRIVDGGITIIGGDLAVGVVALGGAGLFFGASWSAPSTAGGGWSGHARVGERVNGLDAKGQWRTEQRVRRAIGDVREANHYQLRDLAPALELAERLGPNELTPGARWPSDTCALRWTNPASTFAPRWARDAGRHR